MGKTKRDKQGVAVAERPVIGGLHPSRRDGANPVSADRNGPPAPRLAGRLWVYGALVALPVLLYLNTLGNNFVFDDLPLIVEYSKVQQLANPKQLLISNKKGRPTYRIVRTASYAVDYAIGGMNPTVFHASNILYHALTVVVVFRLLQALTGAFRVALLGALLFAAHPIQTDAVAYLSGRRDILSTLFFLLGLLAFIRYRESGKWWRFAMALGAYVLAVLSKEMAITLPLLWLAYDVWRKVELPPGESLSAMFRRLRLGLQQVVVESRLLYLGGFVAAAGAASYFLFVAKISRQHTWYGGSLGMTLLTSARIVVHYIKLLLVPATLSADYSFNAFPVTTSWTDLRAWLALLTLALIAFGLMRLASTSKMAAFGGLWFFITLLPVYQIIPHHELMAEHYLYLPSIGFALLAATALNQWAWTPDRSRALVIGFAVVLLLFGARTVYRNRDWKDEQTLWQKTVQTAPASARAHTNLGLIYLDQGKHAAAEHELKAALGIAPDDVHLLNSLGLLYIYTKQPGEAETVLRQAVAVGMERHKGLAAVALSNIGALYLGQGRDQEAEALFRQAIETAPIIVKPHVVLGRLYLESGRFAEAEQELTQALELRSDLKGAHLMLAHLYLYRGELDKAETEVQAGLRHSDRKLPSGATHGLFGIDPEQKRATDTANARGILAQINLAKGRIDQAQTEAEAALAQNPALAAAHGVMAQVYAARNLWEQAEKEAKEAIRLQAGSPAGAPYHYVLGIIYQRSGKTGAATQEMEAALRLNPRFEAARNALQRLSASRQ